MLFETYARKELIWQRNVLGDTGSGAFAFRGDLVIELGDMHESSQTRNPPKQIIIQATVLVKDDKITFFAGLLDRVEQIGDFIAAYKADLAPGANVLVYAVNAAAPMKTEVDGVTVHIQPYDDGMVWTLLMDDFYLEKSDMKGQSAEAKVQTVADAFADFKAPTDSVAFDTALANTNGHVREARGPV